MPLHLRNLCITQGRIEYENLTDLHSAESSDAILVSGPDDQITGSGRNRIPVVDVILLVSVRPLSTLKSAFPHGPGVNLAIDQSAPSLTIVSSRAPDSESREVSIVFSELPTDPIFSAFGEDGTPIGQSISFGDHEDRCIFAEIENGRIIDPQVLTLTIEAKGGQPVPSVDPQIGPFAVSGMPACA